MYAAICISYADCRDFFSEFGRSQNNPVVCKTDFAVAFSSLLNTGLFADKRQNCYL